MAVWWWSLPRYSSMVFLGLHWTLAFPLVLRFNFCIFDMHRIYPCIFLPLLLFLATSNSWWPTLLSSISLHALLLGCHSAIILFPSWVLLLACISFFLLLLPHFLFSILHLSMFLFLPSSTLLLLLLPFHPLPVPFWFFPLGSLSLLLFLLP